MDNLTVYAPPREQDIATKKFMRLCCEHCFQETKKGKGVTREILAKGNKLAIINSERQARIKHNTHTGYAVNYNVESNIYRILLQYFSNSETNTINREGIATIKNFLQAGEIALIRNDIFIERPSTTNFFHYLPDTVGNEKCSVHYFSGEQMAKMDCDNDMYGGCAIMYYQKNNDGIYVCLMQKKNYSRKNKIEDIDIYETDYQLKIYFQIQEEYYLADSYYDKINYLWFTLTHLTIPAIKHLKYLIFACIAPLHLQPPKVKKEMKDFAEKTGFTAIIKPVFKNKSITIQREIVRSCRKEKEYSRLPKSEYKIKCNNKILADLALSALYNFKQINYDNDNVYRLNINDFVFIFSKKYNSKWSLQIIIAKTLELGKIVIHATYTTHQFIVKKKIVKAGKISRAYLSVYSKYKKYINEQTLNSAYTKAISTAKTLSKLQ